MVRDGANMLIVDPWNEVEHRRRGNESVADYTNRAIRSFKRFASSYDVHGHHCASDESCGARREGWVTRCPSTTSRTERLGEQG